jgi:thioesterase domain-containing protein
MKGYEPPVYDGDVVFFAAGEGKTDTSMSHEEWSPYVRGEIETHVIASEHNRMMEQEPLREICSIIAGRIK